MDCVGIGSGTMAIGQPLLVNVQDVLFSTISQQAIRAPLGVTMHTQVSSAKDWPP